MISAVLVYCLLAVGVCRYSKVETEIQGKPFTDYYLRVRLLRTLLLFFRGSSLQLNTAEEALLPSEDSKFRR